jgi:ribosomal-protein-alanine N-acetyltransferase
MHIECPSCVLRPLVPQDAESLAHYANDPEVAKNLRDRFPHPYQRSDADAYIAHVATRSPQTGFGIVVDGQAIGTIGLILGDDISRCSAEIGYWIGQPFWGRGIATDALRAMTRYGFATFELTRVFAVPFASTSRSTRVLEKAGYVREGVMRQSAVKNGVIHDQWLFATYRDAMDVATR